MQTIFEKRLWVIVLAILALTALAGLASGLDAMDFQGAQPLVRSNGQGGGFDPSELLNTWREIPIWLQAGVWLSIFLIVILIGALLSPENRKRLLLAVVRIAITYWAFFYLFTQYGDKFSLNALDFLASASGEAAPAAELPPPVFEPDDSLFWVSYVVSFLIVLVAAFFSWRTYLFWKQLNEKSDSPPLKDLAAIARASLRDLDSGRDSTDVILNCYYRMSNVVADKRDLQRKASMTPSEFAVRLERAGLPGDSVRRLTRLFESVRYGGRSSSSKDVKEAVACLNTILAYCGEPV